MDYDLMEWYEEEHESLSDALEYAELAPDDDDEIINQIEEWLEECANQGLLDD